MITNNLYPELEPNKCGFIKVSLTPLHELYWEEYGNPNGTVILFLHGGPGSGFKPKYARYFDPKYYRIILFDQRGAGKSRPNSSLIDNTTTHLVEDIIKLRKHLNIKTKMHIFGGSWGSTLALAYAIKYPETVKSLILRGIFLGRQQDIDFFYQGDAADRRNPNLLGAQKLFSSEFHHEKWKEFVEFIPVEERHDMVGAYHRRISDSNPDVALQAATKWVMWETAASKRTPDQNIDKHYTDREFILTLARIESHYAFNKIFWNEMEGGSSNHILDNIHTLATIPANIIQGRYDMICSSNQAELLYTAWEKVSNGPHVNSVSFHLVDDAGHSPSEPGMIEKLIEITNKIRDT